jgi:hypothetical protein
MVTVGLAGGGKPRRRVATICRRLYMQGRYAEAQRLDPRMGL